MHNTRLGLFAGWGDFFVLALCLALGIYDGLISHTVRRAVNDFHKTFSRQSEDRQKAIEILSLMSGSRYGPILLKIKMAIPEVRRLVNQPQTQTVATLGNQLGETLKGTHRDKPAPPSPALSPLPRYHPEEIIPLSPEGSGKVPSPSGNPRKNPQPQYLPLEPEKWKQPGEKKKRS